MKHIILILLMFAFSVHALAQDAADTPSKGDFGIGLGMDYGGIGGRLGIRPSP